MTRRAYVEQKKWRIVPPLADGVYTRSFEGNGAIVHHDPAGDGLGRGGVENQHSTDAESTNRARVSVSAVSLNSLTVSHAGSSDLGLSACSK